MRTPQARHDLPPEPGLPVRLAAGLPFEHQFRPVDRILFEEQRQLAGELMQPARVIGAEIALHFRHRREQLHQEPDQHIEGEAGALGHAGQEGGESLLGEVIRKREAAIGPDAEALRQFQLQPAAHALALHDNRLRGEGRGQRTTQYIRQPVGENFQPVAGVKVQALHRALRLRCRGSKGEPKLCAEAGGLGRLSAARLSSALSSALAAAAAMNHPRLARIQSPTPMRPANLYRLARACWLAFALVPAGVSHAAQAPAEGSLLAQFRAGPLSKITEVIFCVRKPNPTDGHWYANFGYYAHDASRKAWQ
jgi:hypothetical protein